MIDPITRLNAALEGCYRLEREIGAGGMATVYLGEDLKHGREVAIKVLRPELAATLGAERFVREIDIVARLSHPHILMLIESGDADGSLYYVMPYVDGGSLQDRLDQENTLPVPDAIRITEQVASALTYAHEHGVVHRDIKPENILLSGDQAVVADFGIARAVEAAGGERLTQTGLAIGTVAYMSPEQALGEPNLDGRTDVYSLGCVVYQMLSGHLPFTARTPQALLAKRITGKPRALRTIDESIPLYAQRAVERALATEPSERFGSPTEFAQTLTSQTVVERVGRRHLAVLPLENLSGESEEEYFVDGMTEALITSLAKVGALRVVSRTSIMRFKDTEKPLREIAAELGVDVIVEGSAIRDGDRIRITAQLIDAETDEHLWAESYDRDFQDVLILQNEIAEAIAREIELAVTPGEASRLTQAAVVNPDGYDAYLKGVQFFYRLTPQDLETALQYFEFSLEQNPDLALTHSGIAGAWIGLQQMGFVPSSEATPKAETAALRALELDPDLAEAHHWLAVIRSWSDWKWGAAEKLFKHAIELNPSYGDARGSYSHLLAVLGRFDEAQKEIELALQLDPFNAWFHGLHGVVLHMTRLYDEAIEAFRVALRISPNLPFAWLVLTGSLHFSGKFEEAVEAEGSLLAASGDTESQRLLLKAYSERGYREAMGWSADLAAERSLETGSVGVWVAFRYSRAGQEDKVIEWLERAFEQRDPTLPYFLVPELDNVRSDPRVQELMRRLGLL